MPNLSAPPVPICDIRELWMQSTLRPRSRVGRAANLKPVQPYRHPYPSLCHLAQAVLAQAARDAEPERNRGGEHPRAMTRPVRQRQYQALLWLTGTDADLLYWCHVADYPIHVVHRYYRPLLDRARTLYRARVGEPDPPAAINH